MAQIPNQLQLYYSLLQAYIWMTSSNNKTYEISLKWPLDCDSLKLYWEPTLNKLNIVMIYELVPEVKDCKENKDNPQLIEELKQISQFRKQILYSKLICSFVYNNLRLIFTSQIVFCFPLILDTND